MVSAEEECNGDSTKCTFEICDSLKKGVSVPYGCGDKYCKANPNQESCILKA